MISLIKQPAFDPFPGVLARATEGGSFTFMSDSICEKVLRATPKEMECRAAVTLEELKEAFRMIYRAYRVQGYCAEHPSRMHYSTHCLHPASRTFVLKKNGHLIGTISFIGDSPCGLPMESVFPKRVGKLRFRGRTLAEVSLLTLDRRIFGREEPRLSDSHRLMGSFWLFKVLLDYARHVAGVTDLLIVVHPKRRRFYQQFGFNAYGSIKAYSPAGGNPGLPMHMHIPQFEKSIPAGRRFRRFFFDSCLPMHFLTRSYQWTPQALQGLLVDHWERWQDGALASIECLRRRYPDMGIPRDRPRVAPGRFFPVRDN